MKNNEEILKMLRNQGENLEIPESLEPEQMKKKLKQQATQNNAQKYKIRSFYKKFTAAAACGRRAGRKH